MKALPVRINGIEVNKAVKMLGGKQTLYLELVNMFVTDNETIIERLEKAINTNDLKEAERLAHSLKGEAGSIGASFLYEQAYILEEAITEGTYDNKMVVSLSRTLDEVIEALKDLLITIQEKVVGSDEPSQTEFDKTMVISQIKKLNQSLRSSSFSALDQFRDLKIILTSPGLKDEMNNLESLINSFSMEEAQVALERIIKKLDLGCLENNND